MVQIISAPDCGLDSLASESLAESTLSSLGDSFDQDQEITAWGIEELVNEEGSWKANVSAHILKKNTNVHNRSVMGDQDIVEDFYKKAMAKLNAKNYLTASQYFWQALKVIIYPGSSFDQGEEKESSSVDHEHDLANIIISKFFACYVALGNAEAGPAILANEYYQNDIPESGKLFLQQSLAIKSLGLPDNNLYAKEVMEEYNVSCTSRSDDSDSSEDEQIVYVCHNNNGEDPKLNCRDTDEDCGRWASVGECKNNPRYMLDQCKVSCQACSVEDELPDYNDAALLVLPDMTRFGVAQELHGTDAEKRMTIKLLFDTKDYMERYDTTLCRNKHGLCAFWGSGAGGHMECVLNPVFMFEECGPSCGACKQEHLLLKIDDDEYDYDDYEYDDYEYDDDDDEDEDEDDDDDDDEEEEDQSLDEL